MLINDFMLTDGLGFYMKEFLLMFVEFDTTGHKFPIITKCFYHFHNEFLRITLNIHRS